MLDVVSGVAALFGCGFLLCIGAAIFWLATFGERRRARENAIIEHLASALEQNLPVSTTLMLAADTESGSVSRTLNRVGWLAGQGLPLSDAIAMGWRSRPAILQGFLLAGERCSQVRQAIKAARRFILDRNERLVSPARPPVFYATVLLLGMVIVFVMVGVVIIPKFEEILIDFDVPWNPRLRFIVDGFNALHTVFFLIPPLLLFVLPFLIYARIRSRTAPDPGIISQLGDHLRWVLPGLHNQELSSGLASMLTAVRFALAAGMPLHEAAQLAALVDANTVLKDRMRGFANLLREGMNAPDAAKRVRLGGVAAMAFASIERGGDQQAALQHAADYYTAHTNRWYMQLGRMSWPVVTLLFALIVGGFVLAIFLPLTDLIRSASVMEWS